MIKKTFVLITLMLFIFPGSSIYAFQVFEQTGQGSSVYFDSSGDDYRIDFSNSDVTDVDFQSSIQGTFSGSDLVQKHITANDFGGSYFTSFHFNCNRYYQATFRDSGGNELGYIYFKATGIVNEVCDSGAIPSDSVSDGGCDSCAIFNCPGWSDYMSKLDEIKGAIPPPPNWTEVATTFRDIMVPKIISDLDTLLGRAPDPPPPSPKPPNLDTKGIETKEPSMPSNPDLEDSGFNEQDIKDQAPEIPVRDDPTGGFDLIQNPVDSLPELPTDDFPIPGETDPGDWGKNKPKEMENDFPSPPKEGEGEIPSPPMPGDSGGEPPIPGDGPEEAPTPGGDSGTPPIPGGDSGLPGTGCYKGTPGSADGSGSC